MPSKAPEEIRAEEVPATWGLAARVWLAMAWRMVLAMLLGMFLFLLVEYFLFRGQDVEDMRNNFIALFLIPFAVWSVRSVLNKNFGGYRVSVVKKAKIAPEEKNRTESAE
ncbi:MAG: hypothetical protein FJX23_06370 [Alphaproteobacteria bacterium]|nr:hypothetical protein [Alphaproteobacteria bacterium]